jgi:hypothetical protein
MRYLLDLARGAAVVMITSGINEKTGGATDRNELIQATSAVRTIVNLLYCP